MPDPRLLLCDCAGTQTVDADRIGAATGLACSRVHTGLCTHQLEHAQKALAEGDEVIVACQQEAPVFEALAEAMDAPVPLFVDIRDRAGWSDEGGKAAPKMAALLAGALTPLRPAPVRDISSEGMCLILGHPDTVLPVAERLADDLAVTCLLTETPDLMPGAVRRFDVALGRLKRAQGGFGAFKVTIAGYRALEPAGRGAPQFGEAQAEAASECDIILDLSGGVPLLHPAGHRDGYLRADPGDPLAVADAARKAAGMVGTFEKPLYVRLQPELCAHSRAEQVGCTRCIDACATGAIQPAGDHVQVDPDVCAGCGACASVCPSEAIAFDAPGADYIFAQLRAMGEAWRKAGGPGAPRLLVHDADHGRQMIALAARFGRGLPADVIPLEVPSLSIFGHAEAMVALASGFSKVDLLLSPDSERDVLEGQGALVAALTAGVGLEGVRMGMIDVADPDALSDTLYTAKAPAHPTASVLAMGRRRDVTRLAARALAGETLPDAPVPLPAGAPYGTIVLNDDACTLCLSCASLCPSGAILDHPDRPEMRFKEDACLQCGLCVTICPENAITLQPQMDLSDTAFREREMKSEEPFACIECGVEFGVKSMIGRTVERMEAKGVKPEVTRLMQMCPDCKVRAQYHQENNPFGMGERPMVRTAESENDSTDPDKGGRGGGGPTLH